MAILTVPREEELDALVQKYALGARKSSVGIAAGTVNTSYRMEIGEGTYFLRIYEQQGAEGAVREAALLEGLARLGVPTPPPIVGRDGTAVRTIAGKPAALFPWVEGEILCQARVTPAAGRAVGRALARVHLAGRTLAAEGRLHATEGRFGPDALAQGAERIALAPDVDARPLAAPLAHAVRVVAARRATRLDRLPQGLIHGDLFRDNVLWRGGAVAALLDFESASLGPFVYDVAVTLLSWAFGSDLLPDVARAIVAGYEEERPLEHEERQALHDEAILASLRFTITRIVDDAIRVGKRWQRFVARREALERLGAAGLREVTGT